MDQIGQFADLDHIEFGRVPLDPAGRAPFEELEFQLPHAPAALDLVPREPPQPRRAQRPGAGHRQRRRPQQRRAAQTGHLRAGPGQMPGDLQIERLPPAPFETRHAVDKQHAERVGFPGIFQWQSSCSEGGIVKDKPGLCLQCRPLCLDSPRQIDFGQTLVRHVPLVGQRFQFVQHAFRQAD